MNVEYMRTKVMQVYPTHKWAAKVHRMPDDQVVAIFLTFKEQGKFEPRKNPGEKTHQISMYEAFGISLKG